MKTRFWGPFFVSLFLCFTLIAQLSAAKPYQTLLGRVRSALSDLSFAFADPRILTFEASAVIYLLVGLLGVLGIVFVGLFFRHSKKSKNHARQAQMADHFYKPGEAPVMARGTAASETIERSRKIRLGLAGRMVLIFAATSFFFGITTAGVVYYFFARSFESQMSKRFEILATMLSDAAAKQLSARKPQSLKEEVNRYASLPEVAYIFIEDGKGEILIGTGANLPARVTGLRLRGGPAEPGWRTVHQASGDVYETRAGILDGQLGTVHMGVWKAAVQNETQKVVAPIALAIFVTVFCVLLIFAVVVRRITRPLRQLAQNARRISLGELNLASGTRAPGEIGDLVLSMERLRSSLKAAMVRIDPERPAS